MVTPSITSWFNYFFIPHFWIVIADKRPKLNQKNDRHHNKYPCCQVINGTSSTTSVLDSAIFLHGISPPTMKRETRKTESLCRHAASKTHSPTSDPRTTRSTNPSAQTKTRRSCRRYHS